MDVKLHLPHTINTKNIAITGSKSETNRLLLLKALYPGITISNLSESDDSVVMQKALSGTEPVIDVRHAGTAMRFLTAYFAIKENSEVVLTGSQRMKERPIEVLVDALRTLGADIKYMEAEGFPPLRIKGKKLQGGKIAINANVSSQYVTALLLIAPKLENGLQITLEGEVTSIPYVEMTLNLLRQVGFNTSFQGNIITVSPQSEILNLQSKITVESDWSSASYFYSIVALSPVGTQVILSSYKQDSLQGDSALAAIYTQFGVGTEFIDDTITLRKGNTKPSMVNLQLNNTPDIAQTIAVTCFGLGVSCNLTGLHTLKIKETDRLIALKNELKKLGATVSITNDSIKLAPHPGFTTSSAAATAIGTYNDHRMAMAFAPLAVNAPIIIKDAEVVSKSYPSFWEDLKTIGIMVEQL